MDNATAAAALVVNAGVLVVLLVVQLLAGAFLAAKLHAEAGLRSKTLQNRSVVRFMYLSVVADSLVTIIIIINNNTILCRFLKKEAGRGGNTRKKRKDFLSSRRDYSCMELWQNCAQFRFSKRKHSHDILRT